MSRPSEPIAVYLEVGSKRTFACAVEWSGWSRSGRDKAAALQALCDSGLRYAEVLAETDLDFQPPSDPAAFEIVERLDGDTTTDFGAPSIAPARDERPLDPAELVRLQTLLRAYWRAFDAAVRAAAGKELRKGPRGGGRDLDKIVEHVAGAEHNYLRSLGWKPASYGQLERSEAIAREREELLQALAAAARGELPTRGPRGGTIWRPRYFVRRAGWHVLDHLWEIQDRASAAEDAV